MEKTYRDDVLMRRPATPFALSQGLGWGLLGGLAGTLIMDLVLMGTLTLAGLSAFACFSMVGDTVARFFSLLGVEVADGVPTGIGTHYLIGPVVGIIFGLAVTQINALRPHTVKKGIVLAVLFVEIVSQPLLAASASLLKMTVAETVQFFSAAFGMHVLCGAVLGAVVSFGLRRTANR